MKGMKEAQILAVVKEPGFPPRVEPLFENSLVAFQAFVGGYIETLTISSDLVLIVNEEGRLRGLPFSCTVCGLDLVGPVVAVGVKGDEFTSLKASWIPAVMQLLRE
jgi:hypothetical protein